VIDFNLREDYIAQLACVSHFCFRASTENAIIKTLIIHYRMKLTVQLSPHDSVHSARRLLDRYYDTPITIEQLSREVALSPYYFIRLFRRIYRQTPHQYLVHQRIAKAKELLRTTDLPITEICLEVGFESLGSFSALFSKVAGISPSAYRDSVRPSAKPGYIPLCIRMLHGIDELSDNDGALS
jgi:AraC-like DNA-binding protein